MKYFSIFSVTSKSAITAMLQRPDGLDAAGGLTQHGLGGVTHRHTVQEHLVGALLDGDHARLVEDNATPTGADQGVGGTQVDPHVD